MQEYYASHPKPSAPPQTFPPVLGDVVHLRPIRGNTWWIGQGSDDSQVKKIKSKDEEILSNLRLKKSNKIVPTLPAVPLKYRSGMMER
jgi:hypothetical protein